MSGHGGSDRPFSAVLRGFRAAAALTQRELAARSGVSRTTIKDLEMGRVLAPQDATIQLLADGLGLEPAARARLLAAAGGAGRRIPPSVRATATLPNRARRERRHALLGRDRELAALGDLPRAGCLTTVTGAGGIGKSRLALEAAARAAEKTGAPAVLVALETLERPEELLPAVAAALGAPKEAATGPDAPARVASFLPPGALLLLDDADRLHAAAGEIAALAAAATGGVVLVTSRQPLGVPGERVYPVPPLALPKPLSEGGARDPGALAANAAVALFLERAAEIGHTVDATQLPAVADIVAELDGMPLAIELAAAQVHALDPAAILSLLDAAGPRLLVRSAADAGDRQRTMTAAIAWSADLLPAPAQRLLTALGAFRGGFTGEAAAEVLAEAGEPAVFVGLPDLIRASLVFAADGPDRWSMLEPVRYFAQERLDASPWAGRVHLAHARWFARWAARTGAEVFGPRMEEALAAEAADRANAVAAARWALGAGEVELAAQIVDGLWRIWDVTGQVTLWRSLADPIGDRAAEIRDPQLRSLARFHRAICATNFDDPAVTRHLVAEIARAEPGDRTAWALATLARSVSRLDDSNPALVADLREARDVLLATGHPRAPIVPSLGLAGELARSGEVDQALALLQETIALMEREGNRFELPLALHVLGGVHLAAGPPGAARAALGRAVALHRPGHPQGRLAMSLTLLALALGQEDDLASQRAALALAGAAEAWFARLGLPLADRLGPRYAAMAEAITDRIGEAEAKGLLAEGSAMSLAEAAALALETAG